MVTLSLYAPIEEDLVQVEANLKSVAQVPSPFLASLLDHILGRRGKLLRPALTLLAGKLHHYAFDLLVPVATGIELLHTATLVHDDMVDNSLTRRGHPTVNSRWNAGAAVLLGDHIFAKSADFVARANNPRVVRLFAQTLVTICEGELAQFDSSHDWQQTMDDYYRRIYAKTASLFSAAAASGAILSQAPEPAIAALAEYGRLLGMAFQVVDDILDFAGDEAELGKPVGSDLRQGTITLPALLLMERFPHDNPVQRLFDGNGREAYVGQAIAMIRDSDIIDASYSVAADFCRQAGATLQFFAPSPARASLLALGEYVIQRKH